MNGAERLDKFLSKLPNVSAWAKKKKIDETYLSRLRHGLRRPSLAMAALLERVTDGKVPMKAWT